MHWTPSSYTSVGASYGKARTQCQDEAVSRIDSYF